MPSLHLNDLRREAGKSEPARRAQSRQRGVSILGDKDPMPENEITMSNEEWATHQANPLNWSRARKAYQIFGASLLIMWANLPSSSYIAGRQYVAQSFHISTELSIVPLSAGSLGFAVGPMFGAPISEEVGRLPVFWISSLMAILFILGSGVTDHIYGVIVCRILASFFGSSVSSVGTGGVVADVFTPAERVVPMAVMTLMAFVGSPLGFIAAGWAIQYTGDWRYTAWIPLMYAAPAVAALLFMKESRRDVIIRQIEQNRTTRMRVTLSKLRRLPYLTLFRRPFGRLLTEPLVLAIGLYTAFSFAIIYALLAAVPYIFDTVYSFDLSEAGSTWWAWVIGDMAGAALITIMQRRVVKKMRDPETRKQFVPEWSLTPAIIGSPLIPIALFWLAWSSRTDVSWICPVIAMGVYAMGTLVCYSAGLTYLVQVYGPLQGASSSAGARMLSYYLGAAFSLFVLPMLRKLGIAWSLSTLGFVGLALMPTPLLLKRYGPTLRKRATRTS